MMRNGHTLVWHYAATFGFSPQKRLMMAHILCKRDVGWMCEVDVW